MSGGEKIQQQEEEENACWVPLGCGPCECGKGDGTTLYISRIDIFRADGSLVYSFKDNVREPENITELRAVSMCLGRILQVYIPMAGAAGEDDEIVQLFIDGKNVGLEGAKALLARSKAHTAKYHSKKK